LNIRFQRREEVLFVDVTLWSRLAEIAEQYLQKGSTVFVEGRLQLDTWVEKQSGQKRIQVEPASVTVAVPLEPLRPAIKPVTSDNVPPFWTVSVPVPTPPTKTSLVFVQVEPGPVTVTVPLEPLTLPIKPLISVTVPPFWTAHQVPLKKYPMP
jgi:hypothetical protein